MKTCIVVLIQNKIKIDQISDSLLIISFVADSALLKAIAEYHFNIKIIEPNIILFISHITI